MNPPDARASQWKWQAPLLLLAACILVYLPALRAGFLWDDDALVTHNPLVINPGGLRRIWFSAAAPDYAPVTYSAFWAEWRLWGAGAMGYHLVNILLHAASVLLIWRLLPRLAIPGAWLGALIFAVHPVNVASVAWIAELKNTLSLCFYLLAILWYLDAEDRGGRGRYGLALLAAACAFLCKGSTVILPLVLLGCLWWRKGRITREDLLSTAPFFALAAWAAYLTIHFQGRLAPPASAHASFAFRLIRAGDAFWFYVWKDLAPVRLCAIYPLWLVNARDPLSYLPVLAAGACLLLAWRKRNRWGRGPMFAFGYFAVSLLPVLGFINMAFMDQAYVADWWQHLAIIAVAASAGAAIAVAWQRLGARWRPALGALTAGLLLFLGARSWGEALGYQSLEVHCRRTLEMNPAAWTAMDNLGTVLEGEGKLPEAIALYKSAVHLKPNDSKAQLNLGLALQAVGNTDEALDHYNAALRLNPQDPLVLEDLGMAFQSAGGNERAAAIYREALRLDPDLTEAHYRLALALQMQGRVDEAVSEYREVLRALPGNASALNNLGNAFFQQGRLDDAIAQYQAALRVKPDDSAARNNLARAVRKKQLQPTPEDLRALH